MTDCYDASSFLLTAKDSKMNDANSLLVVMCMCTCAETKSDTRQTFQLNFEIVFNHFVKYTLRIYLKKCRCDYKVLLCGKKLKVLIKRKYFNSEITNSLD